MTCSVSSGTQDRAPFRPGDFHNSGWTSMIVCALIVTVIVAFDIWTSSYIITVVVVLLLLNSFILQLHMQWWWLEPWLVWRAAVSRIAN